jgi:UDP-glucose 4-epimerase
MKEAGCKRIVFSSTAAVYGEPGKGDRHLLCEASEGPSGQKVPVTFSHSPIVETMSGEPVNPYGWSKWCVERVLRDYAASDPRFAFVALRYFNVAGAAADGSLGEDHDPETHLIPLLLLAALGRREGVTLFGTDYPTPDGTCIRDYIHVEDLCDAHVLAMEALRPGDCRFYNLGIGRGYSVREVVEAARHVAGREIPLRFGQRRPGDPAVLFADAQKIRRELGWAPRYTELEPIIATAWNWFVGHPQGYEP